MQCAMTSADLQAQTFVVIQSALIPIQYGPIRGNSTGLQAPFLDIKKNRQPPYLSRSYHASPRKEK